MDAVKDQLYNPLKDLAFGGSFSGNNFSPAGTYEGVYVNTDYKGWKLKSNTAAKQHSLNLYLHTAQVENMMNGRIFKFIENVLPANNKNAFAKITTMVAAILEQEFYTNR